MKNLADCLAYIESNHPVEIEMGLTRVQAVAESLGLIHNWSCPIVMVAGTNGKGTTVHTLSTLLHAAGYCVGAYTSPHIFHFSERIAVNLRPVSEAELIQAFGMVEQARIKANQTLTYFEFTTLMALYIFKFVVKQKPIEVLIVEIGLGGRLDAVNILDPDVSVITNIGWDHMDYLGDTLDKIAAEKAGIMRHNKPVILGQGAGLSSLLAIAEAKQATVYLRGRDFDDERVVGEGQYLNQLFPESVQLAIQTLKLLAPKLTSGPASVQKLLSNFSTIHYNKLTGRFQRVILQEVEWIIDVAHNAPASEWLAKNLNQLSPVKTTHFVWCSFADKDLVGIVSGIMSNFVVQGPSQNQDHAIFWHIGPFHHPRSATLEQLNLFVSSGCLDKNKNKNKIAVYETFDIALHQAYCLAQPGDRVVVFGSFQAAQEAFLFIQLKERLKA